MSNVGNCRACNQPFINGGGTCDTCIRHVIAQRDAHLAAIAAAMITANTNPGVALTNLRAYLASLP